MTSLGNFIYSEDSIHADNSFEGMRPTSPRDYDRNQDGSFSSASSEGAYRIGDLDKLKYHCKQLSAHYYDVLESSELKDTSEQGCNTRLSKASFNAGGYNYGSETSINTVVSSPCSDTSQNTNNSRESSVSSLNSAMEKKSFGSLDTSFSAGDRDEDDASFNHQIHPPIDIKLDILRGSGRRKKKTSKGSGSDKSSDKSSSASKNSDKSSAMHLNVNIRKLLSKLKHNKNEKKTKISKSKTSLCSDDSVSNTRTILSATHIEWYTNLFNDYISTDSSDSDDETKNSSGKIKKTNIRGKISVDIEMHKEKITENRKPDNNNVPAHDSSQDKSVEHVKTQGTYSSLLLNHVEVQKATTYKNNRRKGIQSEQQVNNLNHIETILRNVEENNNNNNENKNNNEKNEKTLCRTEIDTNKTPLISSFYKCYDDADVSRTTPQLPYQRRPFSAYDGTYRTLTNGTYDQVSKMIASFDFIASEEWEVTVLTGQQVEILVQPDPDWWWVRTPEGREGFVPKNFLNVIPTVPSRKSDLVRKLMTVTSNSDTNSLDKSDSKSDNRNQVKLPNQMKFSDATRLAKVAPLIHEVDNDYGDNDEKDNGDNKEQYEPTKRPPPPSYKEHIHQTLECIVGQYCDSYEETDQSSTTKSWNSEDSEEELKPRLLRRRSFSGNRQKKVSFSNQVVTYLQDSPDYDISDRYGLDTTTTGYNSTEVKSYC